jgi:hypothetical protein
LLLDYWERKCGDREPIFRSKILLSLIERNFSELLLNVNTIDYLRNYKTRLQLFKSRDFASYEYDKPYFGFVPIGGEFDLFTQELAAEVKRTYAPESVEYLLAEFYSGDGESFFSKLQSTQYQGTVLQNRYNYAVDKYLNYPEMHLSLIAGIWIPTGDIKILGNHPDVGFQVGSKRNKWSYDFTCSFKWGDTPTPYWARRTKSTNNRELTREFFGGYLGFDVGRDVFKKRGHEIQALMGLGYDGFDVFEENSGMPVESVGSYNLNFGLEYRYYFSSSFYIGLRGKYNVVDYRLNHVIDFTGNPITIHLAIGGLQNVFKTNNLNFLGYKGR